MKEYTVVLTAEMTAILKVSEGDDPLGIEDMLKRLVGIQCSYFDNINFSKIQCFIRDEEESDG